MFKPLIKINDKYKKNTYYVRYMIYHMVKIQNVNYVKDRINIAMKIIVIHQHHLILK